MTIVGETTNHRPRQRVAGHVTFETRELSRIPFADFRATHRIPDLHLHLYRPVFEQYRERYDPNAYLESTSRDTRYARAVGGALVAPRVGGSSAILE